MSIGLSTLDAMIARAEEACERERIAIEAHPAKFRYPAITRHARQQTMEGTLARLRAQRAAAMANE